MRNQSRYIFSIILMFIGSFFIFSFLSDPMHSLTDGPDDAFYYLTYARELAKGNLFSWNGIYPSTGFHPLWLFFTSLPFLFTENLNIIVPILSIFLILLFLISLKFFIQLINNLSQDQFIKLIGIFLFSLISANCFFWYMETALSVTLFLGYCLIAFLNKEIKYSTSIALGAFSSLLVLSRMDMVLVIAPIHALFILRTLKEHKWSRALIMTLIPIFSVGAYMLILFIITGTPLPLSGTIKSTFPHFFMLTRWDVLINLKWHGLLSSSITILSLVGFSLSSLFVKMERNIKSTTSPLYCLVIGSSLNVLYHTSFTRTGEIGSWYFAIHYYISIISIIYFLSNFKKLIIIENNNLMFSEKFYSKVFISLSLTLLFFVCFIDRFNHNFLQSQPYAYKQYVEFLDKSNFNKKSRIYDESDGSFAYFSKMPTYHRKGMAATPDYVALQKKFIFKNGTFLFGKELKTYLEGEKIDYIIRLRSVGKESNEEKCILENAKYVMANPYREKNQYIYLIKAEDYEKEFCLGD